MTSRTPTGILLINIGTPDAPTTPSVRRYLREFLSDPRVIDLPNPLRWLLIHLFILPFRPKTSARLYQKIWREEGSPLMLYSNNMCEALAKRLGEDYQVKIGMRYGKPSIENAIENLLALHCKKIIILPLFPQYSSAATGSALNCALQVLSKKKNIPAIEVRSHFYHHPLFIEAYATLIGESMAKNPNEFLLFSYHGIPKRQDSDEPFSYHSHCLETSQLLAQSLGLKENQHATSFQSRLGKTPWITPYTDQYLPTLAQRGIKNITIACPSFVADCLETLEEIGIRARQQWIALGGESLTLVPCLNAHPKWIDAMTQIIRGNS